MTITSFVFAVGLVSVLVAVVAGLAGSDVVFTRSAIVFAICCVVLAVRAALRRDRLQGPDLEVGEAEPAIPPYAAEQEIKRHDRGTIPNRE